MSLRAALLLAILIPSVPFCFFRPFYGIILWTIIAFASPQWLAWGSAYILPVAEMVAAPTLLGFAVFKASDCRRLMARESLLMVVLWIWFTVTTIVSVNTPLFMPHAVPTWARWEFVTKVMLMSLVTAVIVDSYARLRILVMTIAGCFTMYVVKALPFMIMTGGSFRLYGPPKSMVEDNNDLGLALNMTLPLLFFLAHTEANPKVRKVFWFLFAATIPGIFMTYSRGALVGLAAVLGGMMLRVKQRILLVPALVIGVLIAVVFAPDNWKQRMDFTNQDAVMDSSAISRINAWTYSWNLAQEFPVAGGGFDTFTRDLFTRYAPDGRDVHGPHSIYFGVLAEHGFVGLALYMALVLSCFFTLRRINKQARMYDDEVAAGFANMFRFSLVGFLTSGLFLGRAYFDYYFAIVACIVCLKLACRDAWRDGHRLAGAPIDDEEEEYAEEAHVIPVST
jgi:probable O-glycosylation ligase (exosortase A-associated)